MICPVCGHTIEADFGVVTCGRCQAVLFVDMDGNIQVNQEPAAEIGYAPFPEVEEQALDPSRFDQPTQVLERVPPDESPKKIADEIEEFSNSTSTSVGGLSYHLKIEGIDTKEIRTQVERVFADHKLMIDWRELVDEMVNGTIELRQVNPVKASRLVQKLSDLPVKISWRQSVYDN